MSLFSYIFVRDVSDYGRLRASAIVMFIDLCAYIGVIGYHYIRQHS